MYWTLDLVSVHLLKETEKFEKCFNYRNFYLIFQLWHHHEKHELLYLKVLLFRKEGAKVKGE